MIIFSRKDRKERKIYLPFLFHACAGVVANFVTTRVRGVVSSKFSSLSSSLSSSSSSSSFPLRPLREIKISMLTRRIGFYKTKSSFVLLSREIVLPLPLNSVATGVVCGSTLPKRCY